MRTNYDVNFCTETIIFLKTYAVIIIQDDCSALGNTTACEFSFKTSRAIGT